MNHICHHPDCDKEVEPKLLACLSHWVQLPYSIRVLVWNEYRPGQEIDKNPSNAYMSIYRKCQLFWKKGELMSKSVLKTGTYRFILKEWGQTKDHSYKKGFSEATAACFKQEWVSVGVTPADHETFDPETTSSVVVYGLIDPDTGDGIEKGGGKIGFDAPRAWSDFMAMFKASNANPDEMGKPVYAADVTPGMIDIEVKAIPGSGNFEPKNVVVSWRNVERTQAATKLFSAAFSKSPETTTEASKVDIKSVMSGKKTEKK